MDFIKKTWGRGELFMFFIGVFGINEAQKPLGTYNNAICNSCGSYTRYEIYKTYSYFHIFFIPTFRWNIRYYVRAACCGSLFELAHEIGTSYDRGHNSEIRNEHLRPINQRLPYSVCKVCGARFETAYNFCPNCGRKI
jgi:hypothetical protein